MIHFDSHPDMMIPKKLDTTKIYDKDHVLNSLSIENWILPAVYAGHFSTLVWIKPIWATQLDNSTHKFKIGIDKLSKEIKVTCPQSYFVSELAWSPEEKLENVRDITLEVCTMGVPEADDAGVFNYEHSICTLSSEVEEIASNIPYVLDIDLDFYSTRNPFLSLFTEEQFAILRQLYHYEHPNSETEEALQEATVTREKQLQELENIFTSLRNNMPVETSNRVEAIRSLLSTFPTDSPPDLALLHDAGCTCDDCDLPHHVTPRDTVCHLVNVTEVFLKRIPKPALITIARSSRDDYCPPEDVDFIQNLVLQMLKNVFGDIDIKIDYEVEETKAYLPTVTL